MNYSKALALIIKEFQIDATRLSYQVEITQDCLRKLLKNPNWKPRLDTVMKFSYYLNVDVVEFIKLSKPNLAPGLDEHLNKLGNQAWQILKLNSLHIGKTLKYFRLAKYMTQAELSRFTNFQLSAISLRESKRYNSMPTMQTIEIYCAAFGITPETFVDKLLSIVRENYFLPVADKRV